MKTNKIFSLDTEVIVSLQNVDNASKLVNDLLVDYFASGRNLEEEDLKKEILKTESLIITEQGRINNMNARLKEIEEKDKEVKKIFQDIPKAIIDDFKIYPKMTEEILRKKCKTSYKNFDISKADEDRIVKAFKFWKKVEARY